MKKIVENDFQKFLSSNSKISLDADLSNLTTLKLNSRGHILYIGSEQDLSNSLKYLKKINQKYVVLGLGANMLLPSNVTDLVIKLDFKLSDGLFDTFKEDYELPANIPLSKLTAVALKFGIKGWEVFTGIPATLGGAIAMNAGTGLGEIGKLIHTVRIMDSSGEIRDQVLSKKDFSYRKNLFLKEGDIILQATIRSEGRDSAIKEKIKTYLEFRKTTQPLGIHTCGCLFTNNVDTINQTIAFSNFRAGKSLDLCKLKGFRFKNLRLSPIHANFLENLGNSTSDDVKKFIKLLEAELEFQYGIKFFVEAKL